METPSGLKNTPKSPGLIRRSLGIPVHVIWDCDSSKRKVEGYETNKALLRLCGAQTDEVESVKTRTTFLYSCFEDDLETTLVLEIGKTEFDQALNSSMEKFGVSGRDDAIKAPVIMKSTLQNLAERNLRSVSLEAILANIIALKNARPQCLRQVD